MHALAVLQKSCRKQLLLKGSGTNVTGEAVCGAFSLRVLVEEDTPR